MWNENSIESERSCSDQSSAHSFAKSFYHSFVSEQKYDIGTRPHVPNRILCKAAGLSTWRPVLGKGVCSSDSNRTAQRLQMVTFKSSETMSGKILNQLQPKFVAKSVANEMRCLKAISNQRWQDKLRFSIWRFFEQSSFVNIHLLCYWPTIHNSISKICPKFQVISSHFF